MADHWSLVLYREIENPSKIVLSSAQSVVLKDTHPKAQHHYLIVPKDLKIKNVFELSVDHLPLLDDMFQLAKKLIDSLKMQTKDFFIGFKLQPSMQLLNLHVISTDFVSHFLKKPRHWTNFHTRIFLPYDAAYDQLKNKGSIEQLTDEEFREARSALLKCNRCSFFPKSLQELKNHLFQHWKENRNPQVSWRSPPSGTVSQRYPTPVDQRTNITGTQQNASLELPQSISEIKPQPSLKNRFEALNKLLATKEPTPTTTTTTTTTEPVLQCDMKSDQNIVDQALNDVDNETLDCKENVCEKQEEQKSLTVESSQNISNSNQRPSLKERFEALNKMLESTSIK